MRVNKSCLSESSGRKPPRPHPWLSLKRLFPFVRSERCESVLFVWRRGRTRARPQTCPVGSSPTPVCAVFVGFCAVGKLGESVSNPAHTNKTLSLPAIQDVAAATLHAEQGHNQREQYIADCTRSQCLALIDRLGKRRGLSGESSGRIVNQSIHCILGTAGTIASIGDRAYHP